LKYQGQQKLKKAVFTKFNSLCPKNAVLRLFFKDFLAKIQNILIYQGQLKNFFERFQQKYDIIRV